MSNSCSHLNTIEGVGGPRPAAEGCVECLAMGGRWVHLRRCLQCGHIGCCDSSPNRHATAHFHEVAHPLIQSFEPGEEWVSCFVDDVMFELPGLPVPSPSHP
jgi:hypothetical protein